jgi:hypothetical protein
MIIVSVRLDSAISPTRDQELARIHICNASGGDGDFADYVAYSLRGRGKIQLDRLTINRHGVVKHHPRKREHVLNLVAKALNEMGYGK